MRMMIFCPLMSRAIHSTMPSPFTDISLFTVWSVLIDEFLIGLIKSSLTKVRQNDAPLSITIGSKLFVRKILFFDMAALSQTNLLAATKLDLMFASTTGLYLLEFVVIKLSC